MALLLSGGAGLFLLLPKYGQRRSEKESRSRSRDAFFAARGMIANKEDEKRMG
jgi:hypothetical protein